MSEAPIIEALREPPASIEAEQAVLGGLLGYPDAFDRIDWLTEAQFFRSDHRVLYRALRSMIEAGKPVEVLLVFEHLKAVDELERAGGQPYIASLALNTPSAANIHRYAAVIRDKALLRGLMAYSQEIGEAANLPGADPTELLEQADGRLFDVQTSREQSEALPFHATLDAAILGRKTTDAGLLTGYPDLDRLTKRLKGGDLIIVAGRPSMGKSALSTCIAEHCAHDNPVAFYSLEMSRAALGDRILSWHERNRSQDEALAKLAALPLYIDTPSSLSIGMLRVKLRRQKRKYGAALAVVDYLQLMRGEGENRTQEIGSISRGLKQLAVEFDIPLIAVCQLNRGVENRTDKRPLLSDLRESGDIEQDADIVLMVYRDEYYNQGSTAAGTAEILVRKHRAGRVGMARLTFIADYARFESYSGPSIFDEPARPARVGKPTLVDSAA